MPQLDHYNFAMPYTCFTMGFLSLIVMFANVYLPMFYKHRKVKVFLLKEMIARNIILDKEREFLIKGRNGYLIKKIAESIKTKKKNSTKIKQEKKIKNKNKKETKIIKQNVQKLKEKKRETKKNNKKQ